MYYIFFPHNLMSSLSLCITIVDLFLYHQALGDGGADGGAAGAEKTPEKAPAKPKRSLFGKKKSQPDSGSKDSVSGGKGGKDGGKDSAKDGDKDGKKDGEKEKKGLFGGGFPSVPLAPKWASRSSGRI
jgi:hypothetical protein